jgi:hypothetical protein
MIVTHKKFTVVKVTLLTLYILACFSRDTPRRHVATCHDVISLCLRFVCSYSERNSHVNNDVPFWSPFFWDSHHLCLGEGGVRHTCSQPQHNPLSTPTLPVMTAL